MNVSQVARWKKLETLLLQSIDEDDLWWDWELFPNLRLLGLPVSHLYILKKYPRDRPICNFHIYVRSSSYFSPWCIKVKVEHTSDERSKLLGPTLSRLSIVSSSPEPDALKRISDKCDELGIEIVGVASHPLWKRVRYMKSSALSAASHLWKRLRCIPPYVPFKKRLYLAVIGVVEVVGFVVVAPIVSVLIYCLKTF
ncbi:hypothetical protein M408DRAFT_25100 [Serendipita vermifera MAFF 305830]|uniref:Uncharacterized protein n=1 Tax=Serendipita vermifera MAFF 305830 TaxID=933852 RepID=A0A0C2WKG6_SERVB|nr:hypothetical protein M408DRAFT_25100 [Serendipita vermifera MAFF 305830]